jgi:hypothetical protein
MLHVRTFFFSARVQLCILARNVSSGGCYTKLRTKKIFVFKSTNVNNFWFNHFTLSRAIPLKLSLQDDSNGMTYANGQWLKLILSIDVVYDLQRYSLYNMKLYGPRHFVYALWYKYIVMYHEENYNLFPSIL